MVKRVGYLGPQGTFADEALQTQPDLVADEAVPLRSVPHVISAVESGDVDLGLIPLENSVEGSVTVTLDMLAFDTDLLIQREVDLPVVLCLGAKAGTRLDQVEVVLSHPNPLGQSRMWLGRKLPDAITRVTNSTAEAAQEVAKSKKRGLAVITNLGAIERYGLEVLATEIEDHPSETRFVVVGHGIPGRTGHDKTSVVCFQREDRPGSLLAILQEFAARAINLTKLESRPAKRGLGEYCFFIDFEGHIADELVADCLRNVAAKQAEVKFLGSYPVAGHEEARAKRRAATKAWRAASAWVDDLRAQVRATEDLT